MAEKLFFNSLLDIYSVFILLVIFFSSKKNDTGNSLSKKVFNSMVIGVIILLIAEIFSNFLWFENPTYSIFTSIGTFIVYFACPILPGLWTIYIAIQLLYNNQALKRLKIFILIIFIINGILSIISQFTGWYYQIDNNNYQRGPLFFLFYFFYLGLALFSIIILIKDRRIISKESYRLFLIYTLFPIIGIILQSIFYPYLISLNIITLSLLMDYINVQSKDLQTDFLTGVGNRRKLELAFKQRMHNQKPFSAIMLDLDNFKSINDAFGHDIGDVALKKATEILKKCLNQNDLLARFGGDEFCIIVDIYDDQDLRRYVERIRICFQNFNLEHRDVFVLEVSLGYLVYEPNLNESLSSFLRRLDNRMYEDKGRKKKTLK